MTEAMDDATPSALPPITRAEAEAWLATYHYDPDDTRLRRHHPPLRVTLPTSPYFTPCSDPEPHHGPTLAYWAAWHQPSGAHFLLDKTTLVPVSHEEWLWWFGTHTHTIAQSQRGACQISTILLGVDFRALILQSLPIVFETMLFWEGHALDERTFRWATYDEAVEGHFDLVAEVEAIQRGWGSLLEVESDDPEELLEEARGDDDA